jgi:hypothetical protein
MFDAEDFGDLLGDLLSDLTVVALMRGGIIMAITAAVTIGIVVFCPLLQS